MGGVFDFVLGKHPANMKAINRYQLSLSHATRWVRVEVKFSPHMFVVHSLLHRLLAWVNDAVRVFDVQHPLSPDRWTEYMCKVSCPSQISCSAELSGLHSPSHPAVTAGRLLLAPQSVGAQKQVGGGAAGSAWAAWRRPFSGSRLQPAASPHSVAWAARGNPSMFLHPPLCFHSHATLAVPSALHLGGCV